jgi:hypothetical protein
VLEYMQTRSGRDGAKDSVLAAAHAVPAGRDISADGKTAGYAAAPS